MEGQPPPRPATNGTEQRLDDLIGEIRGLRADLARQAPPPPDGEVELREPLPLGRPKRGKKR